MRHLLLLRPANPCDFLLRYYKSLVQDSLPIKMILDMVAGLPLDAVDVFCLYMSRLFSILKENPVYIEGVCNAVSYSILTNNLVDDNGRLLLSQPILHKILPLCMISGPSPISFGPYIAKLRAAFIINRITLLLYGTLKELAVDGRIPESAISVLTHYIPIAQSFSLAFLPPSSSEIDAELHDKVAQGITGDQSVDAAMESLIRLTLRTDSLLMHCDTDDRYEKTDLRLIHVSSEFWSIWT